MKQIQKRLELLLIENDGLSHADAEIIEDIKNSTIEEIKELTELINAASYALADLEGIMPDFEPSGDRHHPGWQTIEDLKQALKPYRPL